MEQQLKERNQTLHLENTKTFRRADLILILVLLVLAAAVFLPKYFKQADGNVTAVITVDGAVVETVDLSKVKEPYTITLGSTPAAVVSVEPGKIRYASADCKDKLCVRTGTLEKPGDTAACLPGKSMIRLEANGSISSEEGPDIISY